MVFMRFALAFPPHSWFGIFLPAILFVSVMIGFEPAMNAGFV